MSRHRTPAFAIAMLLACAAAPGPAQAAESPEALVRQLGDNSFKTREAASHALVKLGERALPALREAAKDAEPEVRWRAEAAARMIRWAVTPDLADKIGDAFAGFEEKKWFERERLVADIAAVGGKTALPALARILTREKSDAVKRAAARAMLRMGPEGLLALERSGVTLPGLAPDDPNLRIEIGNGFLEEGQYERAAGEYRRAIKLAPKNALAWYNLACALALSEKIEEALAALRKAVEFGFDDIDWLKKDTDLDNLRGHKLYKELIRDLEKK